MSRPRYYWYGNVVRTIRAYPKRLEEDTPQNVLAKKAIEESLDEIRESVDGTLKERLINMLYMKNSHTIDGAAQVLHVSFRTATRWNVAFIYKVAEKMGYRKSGTSEPLGKSKIKQ